MYGLKVIVATLVGTSLFVPSTSAGSPPPGRGPQLTVKVLTANGSGCRRDTTSTPPVDALVLPSGAVAVRYRRFAVAGDDYKSCVLSASVATPAGWTYLIPSVSNQAVVTLDAGATASLSTALWFTGLDWTVRDTKSAAGPQSAAWNTGVVPRRAAWAPCGTSVNLTVAETLRVTGGPGNTAGLVVTTLGVPKWRRC